MKNIAHLIALPSSKLVFVLIVVGVFLFACGSPSPESAPPSSGDEINTSADDVGESVEEAENSSAESEIDEETKENEISEVGSSVTFTHARVLGLYIKGGVVSGYWIDEKDSEGDMFPDGADHSFTSYMVNRSIWAVDTSNCPETNLETGDLFEASGIWNGHELLACLGDGYFNVIGHDDIYDDEEVVQYIGIFTQRGRTGSQDKTHYFVTITDVLQGSDELVGEEIEFVNRFDERNTVIMATDIEDWPDIYGVEANVISLARWVSADEQSGVLMIQLPVE